MQGIHHTVERASFAAQCLYRASRPLQVVIPSPSPSTVATFHNTHRNTLPFLRAAGIKQNSREHKELKTTIQALCRQYLHPSKCLEEQAPGCVDQLVANAQITLPWLDKYADAWPARVYLKRYIDGKRPHLMCARCAHGKRMKPQKPNPSRKRQRPTARVNKHDDISPVSNHMSVISDFLSSLQPSLERHLEAFVTLGIKDRETLSAFLSWPQAIQAQFLDEGHGVLQLTMLERKGLLVDCNLLAQKALKESPIKIPRPETLHK